MIYLLNIFAILNFLLHNLHCVWSNDSIVSKSVEGLASAFEIFILHDGHWNSISVFPLNEAIKQFRQNLCSHFKIFIGFLIISEQISHMQRETWGFKSSLLTYFNVTVAGIIDFSCRARESKKLCDHKESFVSAFGLLLLFFLEPNFRVPSTPFWKSWILSQMWQCRTLCSVQFLKAVVVVVLFLLIAADITQ